MPILFEALSVSGMPWCVMSSPQLTKLVTSHYLTALIFRAGWLLGSLDLIGTPTVFIQQVSNGVYDFLQMPYRGLREYGPSGFLQGFSNGSLSLIRNLSSGTITSLTSFASFVSRNMDILSFDPHHLGKILFKNSFKINGTNGSQTEKKVVKYRKLIFFMSKLYDYFLQVDYY